MPWPAMSGALPWTGSNIDGLVPVASMLPDAARPMPPRDRTGDVGDDVAEQVVGDDHVEARRIGHHVDGGGVDVAVRRPPTSGNSRADLVDRALPQSRRRTTSTLVLWTSVSCLRRVCRQREGVAHHALAPNRVLTRLGGDLVRGADADRAAVAGVRALGALADHDEVDLGLPQRRLDAREQLGRAQVHVVIEREPHLQQQPALEHARRDRRIADGAEQDRVVLAD